MLTTTSTSRPDADLLEWVRQWLDLLSAGRLDEACARLDIPPASREPWTPVTIRELVANTYGPGTHFRTAHPEGPMFTSVATARGRPHAAIGELGDGRGYWVDHDVPLNGEFSDLTAQFEFHRRGDAFAVMLRDLHVL